MSYSIAKGGRPYVEFADIIEFEEFHGVDLLPNWVFEHDSACKDFIGFCVKEIFSKEIKNKIKRCNYIIIMCHIVTDSTVIEKEGIYV